jgi:hypothetical protein
MNRRLFFIALAALASSRVAAEASAATVPPKHRVTGTIVSVIGTTLVLKKRNGQTVTADLTVAAANQRIGVLAPSIPIILHGNYLADGTFQCIFTSHAGPRVTDWETDQ